MKTIAQIIADRFGNDGSVFEDKETNIKEILEETCVRFKKRGQFTKYIFKDESSIIIFNDCWDIGTSKDDNNFSSETMDEDN